MRKRIIALIKLIIMTIVFYLLLAFNVFHLGEKLAPSTKDYLEMDITQEDEDTEELYLETGANMQTGHFAADDTANLESLCESANICDKIQFNGAFTDTEKYGYTKIINKIVQFIDENSDKEKQIEEVIVTIEVNKENGNRRGYATRDTIIFNL